MIPLTLKLKNFLSYGPELQTVDFSAYPLICLSGKNGHGKSALLDAITWAIWGQARKESGAQRADQGLIRLGQTHMIVILDFSCNNEHYRVRREYIKTAHRQQVSLDFGIVNPAKDTYSPLTEKNVRATQDKIESILNLTFDSFVNSAFLRQGNANEFSRKTPRDRKAIIATILGINQYDTIKALALEKIKQASQEQTTLAALQKTAEQEIELTASMVNARAELENKIASLYQEEKTLSAQLKTCLQEQTEKLKEHQEYLLLQAQYKTEELEEKTETDNLRKLCSSWRIVHKKLLGIPDSEQLESQKQELLKQRAHHQHLFAQQLTYKESQLRIKEQLHLREKELQDGAQKNRLAKQAELEHIRAQEQATKHTLASLLSSREQVTKECQSLEKDLLTMQQQAQKLAALLDNVQPLEKQFEKRKEYYQRFVEQGNATKHELDLLKQKQQLVHNEDNPSCPLCEQNLSTSRKRFLKKTFEEQESFFTHRLNRYARLIKKLKQLLVEQHADLEKYKGIRQEHTHLLTLCQERAHTREKHEAILNKSALEERELTTQLVTLSTQLKTIEQELKNLDEKTLNEKERDPRLQQLRKDLEINEKHAAELSYSAQEHEKLEHKLRELETQINAFRALNDQKPQQNQRLQDIAAMIKHIKKMRINLHQSKLSISAKSSIVDQLKTIKQRQAELELNQSTLTAKKDLLLQEKGKVDHAHEKRSQLELAIKGYTHQQSSLTATIEDYSIIASASGRDGIQALLIDQALPEIEFEANQLLGKLTNNQTHVAIESLRDLKKGGTRETLDINISDPIGIRPYELFSGGEAFRIDFALRIAIAKLLARRAGTALKTLIIDEGFGSQDEEGLNLIMDAVNKIQEDFAKIIIVSHLTSMKDQFPVHFVVEKTPNGSQVTITENV